MKRQTQGKLKFYRVKGMNGSCQVSRRHRENKDVMNRTNVQKGHKPRNQEANKHKMLKRKNKRDTLIEYL